MHYQGGEFRSQFILMMVIAVSVLLALAANQALVTWIEVKYAGSTTQAFFTYTLLVLLALLVLAFLFARWIVKSSYMTEE